MHGVVRWRLIDLARWLHDEFGVSLTETTVGRELKRLGYVKLTARPRHHAQNEYAMEDLKRGPCSRVGKDQSCPPARHTARWRGCRPPQTASRCARIVVLRTTERKGRQP
ncbi:helix-turn-helix domain-containing protein [Sphingobium sp.]|uniref:helix-turn-helix domain-containing protein n=1 Tax=Sphingobium sp. TaxID=1912891 RepID=UPI0039B91D03